MLPAKVPATIPASIPVLIPDDSYYVPGDCIFWLDMDVDNFTDLSPNKTIVTATGTTLVDIPGGIGKCRKFNGTSDFLKLALSSSSVNLSWEFWLKHNIGHDIYFDTENGRYALRCGSESKFYVYDGGDKYFNSVVMSPEWTHLVLSRENTNASLYINGVFMETVATANVGIGGSVTIGRHHTLKTSFFDGYLGKSRIYERALTAADVGVLFAQDRTKYGISESVSTGWRFELSITGDVGTPTPSMCWLIKGGVAYYASTLSSGLAVFDSSLGGGGWNGADFTWSDMPEGEYTIDIRADGYYEFKAGTYQFTKAGGLVPSSVQMEKIV
jgi:hypothetical protein